VTIPLSELRGRPVLDISSATTVGQLQLAVVDPARGGVVAFRVRSSQGPGDLLPWESITSIGPDAVTVESVDLLRGPVGRAEQRAAEHGHDPIGALVITDRGEEVGTVTEVLIDETSGAIERLVTDRVDQPAPTIIGMGDYALVVEAAAT
jgi:sporulation protein YlmC with PRC-barrel domain